MPKRKCEHCGENAAYVWRSHKLVRWSQNVPIPVRQKKILCERCNHIGVTIEMSERHWEAVANLVAGVAVAFGKRVNVEALIQPTTAPCCSGEAPTLPEEPATSA